MTPRPALTLALACALVALAGTAARQRARGAEARAADAAARLRAVERDAEQLLRLRASSRSIEPDAEPRQDLIARLNRALVEAGIPTSRLTATTVEPSRPLAARGDAPALMRRAARVTLEPIQPADLGRFLSAWRAADEPWIPTQIELQAASSTRRGDDPAYTTRILFEAVHSGSAP